MRADMFKVIVERPRRGKSGSDSAKPMRQDHDAPMFMGMRRGYGFRGLNENLAPLRRFLLAQVGRPWDKVYAEIRATIDARNTVKHHILQHLDDFIAVRTWVVDGVIWSAGRHWRSEPTPLSDMWVPLYVDPRTGLVRPTRQRQRAARQREDRAERSRAAIAGRRRVVSENEQLIAIAGIWYQVSVARLPRDPLPAARDGKRRTLRYETRQDAVRNAPVSICDAEHFRGNETLGNCWLFGAADLYATSKRQLARRELKAAGLVS